MGETFTDSTVTESNGCYWIGLPDAVDSYVGTLDEGTIPADATYVIPSSGVLDFDTSGSWLPPEIFDWLIDSATCRDLTGRCWLTGGGVKFSNVTGIQMAEVNGNGHGSAEHNIGGNVNPVCSSLPGEGGQWNHVNRPEKLHFQGWQIEVVRCGNVIDREPGSESPVTPYNFIEFQGTGTLKGIHGNQLDLDPYVSGRGLRTATSRATRTPTRATAAPISTGTSSTFSRTREILWGRHSCSLTRTATLPRWTR